MRKNCTTVSQVNKVTIAFKPFYRFPFETLLGKMQPLVDGLAASQKAPIPDDPLLLSTHIKEAAYFLRADAVGICKLPSYAVYSHNFDPMNPDSEGIPVELNHEYAIAVLVDQDSRTGEAFSGHDWISNAMSMLAYSNSGFIAIILAEYIRRLGYPARAHYSANYQVVGVLLRQEGMRCD